MEFPAGTAGELEGQLAGYGLRSGVCGWAGVRVYCQWRTNKIVCIIHKPLVSIRVTS